MKISEILNKRLTLLFCLGFVIAAGCNQVASRNEMADFSEPAKPTAQKELTAQDCSDAESLLSLAELEINACRKISGKSPQKGVDACKEVMEKYPGTEYADKARGLLKRVPQRFWEKCKIAELLGL